MPSKFDPVRRLLIAGAAAALTGADKKDIDTPGPPLFTHGPLADNLLASYFKKAPDGMAWPNVALMTQDGKIARIEQFRGKTLMVNLWAEWCPPCVAELPGMAILQNMTRSDKFELVSIMSGTNLNEPADGDKKLRDLGIKSMRIFMDGTSDKDRLLNTLGTTTDAKHGALPCNLLLDSQGRVRGRSIGGEKYTASDGKDYSIWRTNIALQFCQALADGALDAA